MVTLQTNRLLLRPEGPDDARACWELYSDPEVTAFLGWTAPSWPEYRELYARILEKRKAYPEGLGVWGGFRRDSGRFIGEFLLIPLEGGPEVEVGYYLAREAWGQGYATEGARALLRHGLEELGLEEIVAVVRPGNERSLAVVRRLGLLPDGEVPRKEGRSLRFRTAAPSSRQPSNVRRPT